MLCESYVHCTVQSAPAPLLPLCYKLNFRFCMINYNNLLCFQDIVVRVCFILGNLTADDEDTRFLLYFQHLASQYLTPLLQQCVHLQLEQVLNPPLSSSLFHLLFFSTSHADSALLFFLSYYLPCLTSYHFSLHLFSTLSSPPSFPLSSLSFPPSFPLSLFL